jgi:outer membrane murein-binding lipoprotein Lpp
VRDGVVAVIVAQVRTTVAPGLRDLLFVGFLTTILAVGVLGVLLLNTAMQQQSDRMTVQRQRVAELAQQAQQLRTQIDRLSTPQQLAARARALHMQPVKRLRFTVAGAPVSRQTPEGARSRAN